MRLLVTRCRNDIEQFSLIKTQTQTYQHYSAVTLFGLRSQITFGTVDQSPHWMAITSPAKKTSDKLWLNLNSLLFSSSQFVCLNVYDALKMGKCKAMSPTQDRRALIWDILLSDFTVSTHCQQRLIMPKTEGKQSSIRKMLPLMSTGQTWLPRC